MQNPTIKVNPDFLFLWEKKHRFMVLKGGAGSSKSYSVMQYLLTEFVSQQGCNIIMCRKVQRTLRVSVFALMKQLISNYGMLGDFKINRSDLEIRHLPTGNQMFFMGMDDPEKIKSVTAENGTIEKIFIEEASEFEQADIDQLNARLRGFSNIVKQIIIAFNPISEDHWLKEAFWDKCQYSDAYVHESNYTMNYFIDEEYKSQLESYKHSNPYFYSVYCKGEWGSIGDNDVIIPYHLAHKARYRDADDVDQSGPLCIGVDVARYGDDNSVAYIKRGMKVLDRRVLDITLDDVIEQNLNYSEELAKMIIKLISLWRKGADDKVIINVDATGVGASVDTIKLLTKHISRVEINEINFGGNAEDDISYENASTEMYFRMRDLLPSMKLLEHDSEVMPELTKRRYSVDWRTTRNKIEKKDDFKKRLLRSPDYADALVLAFYSVKQQNSKRKKSAKDKLSWTKQHMR